MAKKKPGSNGCVLLFFLVLCLLGGLFIRSTPPKWVEDRGTVTEILAKPGSTDVKVSYTYRAQRPHSRSGYTTYADHPLLFATDVVDLGPVSLGFLGLGMLITNASTLSR